MDDLYYHPSGLLVPGQKRPTAIDLFCGAGGMTLGLIRAGWQVLAGLDNDPAAFSTYIRNLCSYPVEIHYAEPEDKERLNKFVEKYLLEKRGDVYVLKTAGSGWISRHPEHPPVRHFFFGDARKWSGRQILEALGLEPGQVDCVVGGPPCQGFSRANRKRNVMDPRNSLVFEFLRIALEIAPKVIIFENVPGILDMVTPEGIPVMDAFCRVLEDGGFSTYEAVKRVLLATSGAGAVLRRSEKKKWVKPQEEESSPKPYFSQMTLFG